jgi:hypothetical protein
MFERIQNDGVSPKTATVSGQSRAELVVSPQPVSTELPEKAVAASVGVQRSSTESDLFHPMVHLIGQVSDDLAAIADNEAERARLEKMYARLFKAYAQVTAGKSPGESEKESAQVLEDLEEMLLGYSDPVKTPDVDLADDNAAAQALRWQRENTLAKITLALRKVGSLRSKLTEGSDVAHNRLLSINSSIAGLNMARAQVDDSSFGISSASTVVDSVMLNLRSTVLAHGNISADVVRLVMN